MPQGGERDRMGLLQWLEQHFADNHSLAAQVAMSHRSFTRHFRQLTGTTVGQWLVGKRLGHAQRLLETSQQSIDAIALTSDFSSALSMRQHFTGVLHLPPSAYRAQLRRP